MSQLPDKDDASGLQALLAELEQLDAAALLRWALQLPQVQGVFTTSLGLEDQVVLDMLANQVGVQTDDPQVAPKVAPYTLRVATLDTGRLHQETYDVLAANRQRYPQVPIQVYFPQAQAVEQLVANHGINCFYDSRELRTACCAIRKVEPLGRALAGAKLWITGLRRDQAATRGGLRVLSYDEGHKLWKLAPLWNWTSPMVADYAQARDIPRNALHAKGFPSIGCAPCTRAVQPGEDERAGRWWWEAAEHKECGLHVKKEGVAAHHVAAQGKAFPFKIVQLNGGQ